MKKLARKRDRGRVLKIEGLRMRLEEAEDTLRAIRTGQVDAIVVQGPDGEQVYTLRGADEPYRLLVESMGEGAALLDPDGTTLYANASVATMLGKPIESLPGAAVASFVTAESLPPLLRLLKDGLREPARGEVRFRRAEGGDLPVRLSVGPLNIEGKLKLSLLASDLSAEKRAEVLQNARAQAVFLSQASALLSESLDVEVIPDKVAELGVPYLGDCCVVHLLSEEGGGRPPSMAHGDPERSRFFRRVLDRHPFRLDESCGILKVLRTGVPGIYPRVTDEVLWEFAVNEEHLGLLKAMNFRSGILVPMRARNQTIGVMGFALCASDRRYGPGEMATTQDLANRAALAIDNARLYRGAVEAISAREEFIAIASHELKTPLTALLLYSRLLLDASKGEGSRPRSPEEMRAAIEAVDRQGKRLNRLTAMLLDMSRISAGRFRLEVEEMDLAALTRSVVEQLRGEGAGLGVAVDLEADGPVLGRWDRVRLEEVLSNLLSNAIKFGGGNPVRVRVESDDERARVSVEDRGRGIEESTLRKLFRPFARGNATPGYSGLGLGLYVSRQIVEAHAGTLTVRSEWEKGSTFLVDLPRNGVAPIERVSAGASCAGRNPG